MNKRSVSYSLYRFLTTGLYYAVSPAYKAFTKIRRTSMPDMDQRLGDHDAILPVMETSQATIWIHAASVGEVNAAAGILEKLLEILPDGRFIFSTTTKHGQSAAIRRLGKQVHCVYAPLDFIASIRKALRFFRPDILVCIETEIWPNWLYEAHAMGIKTAIVNGRMSSKSIRHYMKFKALFETILQHVSAFSMIGDADAARIKLLGAPVERVQVNGNAKYDRLIRHAAIADLKKEAYSVFHFNDQDRILVAGSTRTHEEEMILDAYAEICRTFPDTRLIIAPRHIERTPGIEKLMHRRGMAYQLRTAVTGVAPVSNILILNTIGELQAAYSIASAAFCGGSLVPLGGHNILEAAAVGTPVFYGPYMDDFSDARDLLETRGGGCTVTDAADLAEKISDLFTHPAKAHEMGRKAIKAVLSNQGASEKHAMAIQKILRPQ